MIRHYITKSRSGHYTVTVTDGVRSEREGKLELDGARHLVPELKARLEARIADAKLVQR